MFTDLTGLRIFLMSVNTGTLVLIWVVHWMVYPSFYYFAKSELVEWHSRYAPRMGRVAAPLMIAQLLGYSFLLVEDFSVWNCIKGLLVMATWGMTIGIFVPLHAKIASTHFDNTDLDRLVRLNFIRALAWTFLFLLELYTVIRFG